jgi:hypothetical protein
MGNPACGRQHLKDQLPASCNEVRTIRRRISALRALVRVLLCGIQLLGPGLGFVQRPVPPLPQQPLSGSTDSDMSANQSR